MTFLMIGGGILMWIAILCAALSLSPTIFENKIIKVDQMRKPQNSDCLFMIFAALGWIIIYYNAIYGSLWFISEDRGYIDSNGEWVYVRASLSGTIGLWLTGFTYMTLNRLNILEIQLREKSKPIQDD